MDHRMIQMIRAMIEDGATNADITDAVADELDARAETDRAIAEDEARYGDEWEDHLSDYDRAHCDRLDMGRNEAGEWLGYM